MRLTAALLLVLLLSAGCGQGGSPGADGCPTDEEVRDLSSQELNEIPRECDSPQPRASDAPGVSVGDDGDDRDGLPTSMAKDESEDFGLAGELIAAELSSRNDADFWGLQWEGGALRVVATSPGSSAHVAVTDLEGAVLLEPISGPANELVGSLPSGRYLVRVVAEQTAATPVGYSLQTTAQ